MTALHYAAEEGHLQVCKALVLLKADPSIKNQEGMAALEIARVLQYQEIVSFLTSISTNQPEPINNDKPLVKQPVEPEPVKKRVLSAEEQQDFNDKLLKAATNGALQECKDLLEKGADVNGKDNDGWTPLHRAAWSGRKGVCHLLVSKGADVRARNNNGKTAGDLAQEEKYPEVYEYLTSLRK
ncbi:ankyrin repeat-containing domain protein [Gorgonomyces haynaldii]|nr:ankyrin repeat-containing domain protein [Gorgonomyces haynaldii]